MTDKMKFDELMKHDTDLLLENPTLIAAAQFKAAILYKMSGGIPFISQMMLTLELMEIVIHSQGDDPEWQEYIRTKFLEKLAPRGNNHEG